MSEAVTITYEFLERYRSPRGGYPVKTQRLLGVPIPARKGWRRRLIGTKLGAAQVRALEEHQELRRKQTNDQLWLPGCGASRRATTPRGPGHHSPAVSSMS
jgi:hypothetical protein